MLHIISTHANCFDGAAAAVILHQYCKAQRQDSVLLPHTWGHSFLRDFGQHVHRAHRVVVLMFDVCPDQELVDFICRTPAVSLICGDHHVGMKPFMDKVAAMGHARLRVRFDDSLSGAQLAWLWARDALGGAVDRLNIVLDGADGASSRLLDVVGASDMYLHKGRPDMEAVNASMRLLHRPDAASLTALLTLPGSYEELLRDGRLCSRIEGLLCSDLLKRGRAYRLQPSVLVTLRAAGVRIADAATVFYVQAIPQLASEMGFLHVVADMVWLWSKTESARAKRYGVSIRRGRASDIRCDIVAATLGGGNGHAEAARMAFDAEPLYMFVPC